MGTIIVHSSKSVMHVELVIVKLSAVIPDNIEGFADSKGIIPLHILFYNWLFLNSKICGLYVCSCVCVCVSTLFLRNSYILFNFWLILIFLGSSSDEKFL